MSILITGGAGFIGSHLAQALVQDGQRVVVLDDLSSGKRSNLPASDAVTLVEGDVEDAALLGKLAMEATAVFNLAAIASVQVCEQEPARAERTNVAGCQAVFDAVAAAAHETGQRIPVVYASSAAVYGDNPQLPLTETMVPAPINRYGMHKQENEHIAALAYEMHGVQSIGLRFFNVYGARQDPASPYSGVISKFMAAARSGHSITIFGDGEQTRDFIYVGDVVAAMRQSATLATGAEILNVCTGETTSLNTLARVIGEISGTTLPITHAAARAGDIRHSCGDVARLRARLGITAATPLAAGLAATMASDA